MFHVIIIAVKLILSNGHSPANLSNSCTRRKFAIFGEFEYSPKWSFLKIGRTRYIRRHSPTCFGWTRYICPTFANHFPRTRYIRERQIYTNLASLANLANLRNIYKLACFIYKTLILYVLNGLPYSP